MLTHLAVGGAICQYEDDIAPYMDTMKAMYKDFVSVKKDAAATGPQKLVIASHVYRVTGFGADAPVALFPSSNEGSGAPALQNFCYLCIDPVKRVVLVWYNGWLGI